ncbi:MAG: alternative ribosome rescue aminoacyl-tRNA hydrolase ArfB [Pirellulaceae bacterium]
MLFVNDQISISIGEFDFTFSRSPGPGGQNVNKVSSKATLSWYPDKSSGLPGDVLQRLKVQNKSRFSQDGKFQVSSHRFRDQSRNIADCLTKLREMILLAAIVPKNRKKTKPSFSSQRRRLDNKKKKSEKKNMRRSNVKFD